MKEKALAFLRDVRNDPKFAGLCALVGAVVVVAAQIVFRLAK